MTSRLHHSREESQGNRDHRKGNTRINIRLAWCVPLGILSLICACVLLAIDPVQIMTTKTMKVRMDSMVHDFLSRPMEGLRVTVSLFNVTNAPRFQAGEDQVLRVQEVGPFTYKETRCNEKLEIDEEAGLIRYEPRIQIDLVPEESVAHPDNVTLTLPNLAMLGLATIVNSYNYWTRMTFNLLVLQLDSQPMVTLNASAYLWGYREPLLTFARNFVPGYVNFEKLGLMDRIYDRQTPNRLEVSARDEDKFMIKTRNGLKKLPMGKMDNADKCEICDDFLNAYEGLVYPTPTSSETSVRMFKNGVCRILPMEFHKTVVYDSGVEGLLFNLSDSFFSLDHNATNNRMLDMHECFYGIPLSLSKAYFQDVDSEVYKRIEGVREPDPAKQSYIVIEPKIAMELETVIRVQLNLVLPDLGFSSRAGRYSQLVVPVLRLDFTQPPLPQESLDLLRRLYVTGPLLLWMLKTLLLATGAALVGYPAARRLLDRASRARSTAVRAHAPLLNTLYVNGIRIKREEQFKF